MASMDGEIEALVGGLSAFALLTLGSVVEAVRVPTPLARWFNQAQKAEISRRNGVSAPLPSLDMLVGTEARGALRGIDDVMLHTRTDARLTAVERDRLITFLRALRDAL